jgi:peptidoglycan-N-acetylglucosamine deacetylase
VTSRAGPPSPLRGYGGQARVTSHLRGSPHVYLTFDDGPDPRWTPRVLDLLETRQVHATFFAIGRAARQHPALLRRIAAGGHRIGNHTWSHRHTWTLSSRAARQEVRDGAAAIADVTGVAPDCFRPPHGRLRRCTIDEAARGGQRIVLWSVSAVDWGPFGSARRIAARLRRSRAGDVVLMHDGQRRINRPSETLAALPGVLDALARQGLPPAPLPRFSPSGARAAPG